MLRISGLAGLGNKMMKTLSLLIVLTILAGIAFPADRDTAKPQTSLLWPDGAPGAKGDSEDDKPTITAFIPPANSVASKAVVIFPGGGYGKLSMENEGAKVASWLNSFGVAAFVVSYRHSGKGYRYPAPLDDAQRAMRLVRSNAAGYNIDPDGIGVLGHSCDFINRNVLSDLWCQFCSQPEKIGWFRPWSLFVLGYYLRNNKIDSYKS